MKQREAILKGDKSAVGEELARVRAEYERRLAELEADKRRALERQLVELTGSAAEQAAVAEAREKEERVEILFKQFSRRIISLPMTASLAEVTPSHSTTRAVRWSARAMNLVATELSERRGQEIPTRTACVRNRSDHISFPCP